jgi:hypothetical protein
LVIGAVDWAAAGTSLVRRLFAFDDWDGSDETLPSTSPRDIPVRGWQPGLLAFMDHSQPQRNSHGRSLGPEDTLPKSRGEQQGLHQYSL